MKWIDRSNRDDRLPGSPFKKSASRQSTSAELTLDDVITLNLRGMSKKRTFTGGGAFLAGFFGILFIDTFRSSALGLAVCGLLMAAVVCMAAISTNYIFNKSLFGEEACQYMTLPIPFRTLVIGKLCAGSLSVIGAALVVMVCGAVYVMSMYLSGDPGYRDITEALALALINLYYDLFDGVITTASVLFIIAAAPLAAVIEGVFISAIIQYGAILRNLLDPQRSKAQITVVLLAGGIAVYAAATVLFLWIPGLFFENDFAISQFAAAGGLKIAGTVIFAKASIWLLEQKYALN